MLVNTSIWPTAEERAIQDREIDAAKQRIRNTPGCDCVVLPVNPGTTKMTLAIYTYKCPLHNSLTGINKEK